MSVQCVCTRVEQENNGFGAALFIRLMARPTDPSDYLCPPAVLTDALFMAHTMRQWHRGHTGLFARMHARVDSDAAAVLARHTEKAETYAAYVFYFQNCSNSRSQVEYLGADIAWACDQESINQLYAHVETSI